MILPLIGAGCGLCILGIGIGIGLLMRSSQLRRAKQAAQDARDYTSMVSEILVRRDAELARLKSEPAKQTKKRVRSVQL